MFATRGPIPRKQESSVEEDGSMTQAQYAKAKALAADERTDPATRAAAQRQIEKWKPSLKARKTRPRRSCIQGASNRPSIRLGRRTWR